MRSQTRQRRDYEMDEGTRTGKKDSTSNEAAPVGKLKRDWNMRNGTRARVPRGKPPQQRKVKEGTGRCDDNRLSRRERKTAVRVSGRSTAVPCKKVL